MKRLLLGGFLALMISMGLFIPQAGAFDSHLNVLSNASIMASVNTGHMATFDWLAWLKSLLGNVGGNYGNGSTNGSVPIPGTLLLLGGGLTGLIVWRARQPKD